jgi:hypothetical protein
MNMSAKNAAQWLKNGRADRFVYERTPQRVLKVRTLAASCAPMRPWIREEGGTWVKHARCRARAVATIGHEECTPVVEEETGEHLWDAIPARRSLHQLGLERDESTEADPRVLAVRLPSTLLARGRTPSTRGNGGL